jgi:O-acetyl-ADP-ribose deacetylase (regulator of RNase III)
MINNYKYNENVSKIVSYLNHTTENNPQIIFPNDRSKIKYYMTTLFVSFPKEINQLMDQILQYEIHKNPIINVDDLHRQSHGQIILIQNDITQIKADVIVNAANGDGLGCFDYEHKCIDNIIHNKAGPMLRLECRSILKNSKIPTSGLIITKGYNLPCKYIIHTVGPIYAESNKNVCEQQLVNCYTNCLNAAHLNGLNSIVFCCISTGVYGFPPKRAAEIAITSVRNFIRNKHSNIRVFFCTFTDNDFMTYQKLLSQNY